MLWQARPTDMDNSCSDGSETSDLLKRGGRAECAVVALCYGVVASGLPHPGVPAEQAGPRAMMLCSTSRPPKFQDALHHPRARLTVFWRLWEWATSCFKPISL